MRYKGMRQETMEENNNQQNEFETTVTNKKGIISRLKRVKIETLYTWLMVLLFAFIISVSANINNSSQTAELKNTISSMEDKISKLNDDYDSLNSYNEELKTQLQEYQDQQETIDDLNKQLTDLQSQYDAIIKENETLKSENASLKSQLEQKQASAQSSSSSSSSSGTWRSGSSQSNDSGGMVWLSETGEKYHSIPDCGRMNPNKARQVTKSAAEASGYEPCSKCY